MSEQINSLNQKSDYERLKEEILRKIFYGVYKISIDEYNNLPEEEKEYCTLSQNGKWYEYYKICSFKSEDLSNALALKSLEMQMDIKNAIYPIEKIQKEIKETQKELRRSIILIEEAQMERTENQKGVNSAIITIKNILGFYFMCSLIFLLILFARSCAY